jgi:hypothetical protein
MLAIIAAVLWIVLDVAMTLLTSPPIPLWQWRTIVYGGGAVVVFTIVAGIYEHFHTKKEDRNRAQETTDLKERLIKQEGFNEGAFQTLGGTLQQIASATPESSGAVVSAMREELQKYQSRIAQLVWAPLTSEQKIQLRNALSKLQREKLAIVYHGDEDCEYLAHGLEQVFLDVGWTLAENTGSFE